MANYYHISEKDVLLTKKAIQRSNEKYFRRRSVRTMTFIAISFTVIAAFAGYKNSFKENSVVTQENPVQTVITIMN